MFTELRYTLLRFRWQILGWGLGIACFVPNLHAYLSARLPYSLRARGLGMVEYSWALTGIIGAVALGITALGEIGRPIEGIRACRQSARHPGGEVSRLVFCEPEGRIGPRFAGWSVEMG